MILPTTTLILVALLQPAPVANSTGEAATIVRNAADALGGQEQVLALERIEFGFEGTAAFPYQGPTPDVGGTFEYSETTSVDMAKGLMQVESGFTGGETAFMRRSDYDASRAADFPAFARQLRQSPHALLRHWLATPRNLVLVATREDHWVIAGPLYGSTVHAYINRETQLVEQIELPFDDLRYGDAVTLIEFGEYQQQGSWQRPSTFRVVEARSVIFDLPYASYRFNPPAPESQPADDSASGGTVNAESDTRPEVLMPSPDTFMHRDVGDGVRVLFNSGGNDYHSLAVLTDDGVLVIETPGSIAHGKGLVERALGLGAVTRIAATHHHGDHAGAMPGVAGSDRILVVAESHREFFRDMVTAPRRLLNFSFDRLAEPRFETVAAGGERLIGDRVVAFDAGPSGHSDAQLVFYVADAKLLFQSDMAVFRWDGSVEAGRTQTCRLREFIAEQALEVDLIVGGHGRPGTLGDLDRAIAQREDRCPQ